MPPSITESQLLHALNWRYATQNFDPARKIPAHTWAALEQALILSPSSFGLQPWKFIVVTDPALRTQLKAASWNQPQITDASHLVVLAIKKDLSEADIEAHIRRIAEVRNAPLDTLASHHSSILRTLHGPLKPHRNPWATQQIYLALGTLLTAAALLNIDACPMEGLDPHKYDTLLHLKEKNLATTVVATLGYRAADDPYATLPKVRFHPKDVLLHL